MEDRSVGAIGSGRNLSWTWSLGISVSLHLIVLGLLPALQRSDVARSGTGGFQVHLAPRAWLPIHPEQNLASLESGALTRQLGSARSGWTSLPKQADPVHGELLVQTGPPLPDTAVLMESARRLARGESHRLDNATVTAVARVSPEAAVAAMAARSQIRPEETRLADGTLRVVNQWGVRYCTKAPPDFQRSGPVGHDAVVTNCL